MFQQPRPLVPYMIRPPAFFSPASLPNLIVWLDGQRGLWKDTAGTSAATLNGDAVARWDDQSGHGNNALQATAARRPTLATAWRNSKNALAYVTASNQWQATAAFSADLTQPNTIYIVLQLGASPASNVTPYDGTVSGKRHTIFNAPATWNVFAGTTTTTTKALDTSAHVFANLYSGASSYFFIDNTNIAITGNPGTNVLSGLIVGGNLGQSATAQYGGNIAELLVYNANHGTANRQSVQTYLASKYGITLN